MFRLNDGVSFTLLDSEAIVSDMNTGIYLSLNATAADILQAVIDGETSDSIVTMLQAKYRSVTVDRVRADYHEVMTQLVDNKILVEIVE